MTRETNETAYCGIYCPDCIRYKNGYSGHARQLKAELERVEFRKYADTKSPFGAEFDQYTAFHETLTALADIQCENPCRVGGGCSGTPCSIMECCLSKGFQGCWECGEVEGCDKFGILTPRCGDMPKRNIATIRKHGMAYWKEMRAPFYIWQKQGT